MAPNTKYVSKLDGKKILVIGGSSGIGFSVAEASLEHGAGVTISSSNPNRVKDAVSRLQNGDSSAKISGEVCNIGDAATVEQNLKSLLDKCGKLDHIVWTAADPLAVKPLAEVDAQFIIKAGTTRFLGPLLLGKLAPKYLNAGPQSSIVFTTGAVSERPMPNWTVINGYATGIQGFTRGMALDLKPIRVNCVSPGGVKTELWSSIDEKERQQLFEGMAKATTVGSIGSPEDVAESYIYLMKDHNITGTMISTNGGALLLGPH